MPLLGLSFLKFTASLGLHKQFTRMPFHQDSFQHKSSSHFADILLSFRSIAGKVSRCHHI